MPNKRIIVFSDNHNYDGDMLEILNKGNFDLSVNCGDHFYSKNKIEKYFDYYVDGNNDVGKKHTESFSVLGKEFLITHGHKEWDIDINKWVTNLRDLGKKHGSDVVIFGHSHVEMINLKDKPYVVNPGSISLPRSQEVIGTYLIINVTEDDLKFEIKQIK